MAVEVVLVLGLASEFQGLSVQIPQELEAVQKLKLSVHALILRQQIRVEQLRINLVHEID